MENKLLSIIIPTFNGGKYLKENLEALLPQVASHIDEIEFLVCDNASEDETPQIVEEFQRSYTFIKYNRRDMNIGSMNNFAKAVHESNGQYVFLLGDDDVVMPHFVLIVLDVLKNNRNLGLFHWNRVDYIMNNDTYKLFDSAIQKNNLLYVEKDYAKYLKKCTMIDSMSTVLFRRDCWLEGEKYCKETYFGYLWLSIILNGAVDNTCAYYNFPLIIQRHPLVRKWDHKILLYRVGIHSLYRDLDKRVPTIMNVYEKIFGLTNLKKTSWMFERVSANKAFYRENYNFILEGLTKTSLKRMFIISLKCPLFVTKIINKILRLYI